MLYIDFVLASRGYDGNMDWKDGEGHPFTYFIYAVPCSEAVPHHLTGDHKVTCDCHKHSAEQSWCDS